MTPESWKKVSDIDLLFAKLDELKQQHEQTKEQTLKKIGVFEHITETANNGTEKFVANLAANFLSERATRISEDLNLFEITLSLIREQAKEIDDLKRLVASSASYEKLAEDIKKRLKEGLEKDYGEVFEFLEDFKQRLAKQDAETQERIHEYNR